MHTSKIKQLNFSKKVNNNNAFDVKMHRLSGAFSVAEEISRLFVPEVHTYLVRYHPDYSHALTPHSTLWLNGTRFTTTRLFGGA